jgi:hypothetical protein
MPTAHPAEAEEARASVEGHLATKRTPGADILPVWALYAPSQLAYHTAQEGVGTEEETPRGSASFSPDVVQQGQLVRPTCLDLRFGSLLERHIGAAGLGHVDALAVEQLADCEDL